MQVIFEDGEVPGDLLKYFEPIPDGLGMTNFFEFSTQPYPDAHFATFPRELPRRCILAASKQGDIILDPFAGSGTTLMAAKSLGRKSIGIELSADYCDLARKRVEAVSLPLKMEV